MFSELSYEESIKKLKNRKYIFIDVRSPGEFNKATIPGSINIPILDDEERALVGTIYKQESSDKAKKTGVEIVSKKLPKLYDEVQVLREEFENLVFFCSRGGYRSSSLVYFFRSLGFEAIKLIDGYKGYRNYINSNLEALISSINFIVLYGNTGTGKTHILQSIENLGYDVLDLEGCANHRGSILGSVGLGEQNSQKMFESLLFHALVNRKSDTVFIEGESRRIGKDVIPICLFEAMKKGQHIKITASMENRINNILRDYVGNTDDELINSLTYLRKYLGNECIDNYLSLIANKDYIKVIEDLIVKYYDPLYEHNTREYLATFCNGDADKAAKDIITWMKSNPL